MISVQMVFSVLIRDRRALLDATLLALLGAAGGFGILQVQPFSAVVMLLAMCVIPGAALLTRLGFADPLTTLALAVALSLAIATGVATILAWSGWWHPELAAIVLAVGAAMLLFSDLRRALRVSVLRQGPVTPRRRLASSRRLPSIFASGRSQPSMAPAGRSREPSRLYRALSWLTVLAPIALWWISLQAIDLETIGRHGLSASLPVAWYAALAIVLAGSVRTMFAPRFDGVLAAAQVGVAVLIVYATIPAVADMPQYAWTYKHIGVTQSIEQAGSVAPLADIYHRWPGFFALTAAFSRLSGLGDPISYAAWAEPVFSLVGAVLVAAIARTVSGDSRVAGLAAMFFVVTGWVAQSYYAPQPLAYVLGLALMLIVVRQLTNHRHWHRWVVRFGGPETVEPALLWSRRSTLAVVIALDAVIVITHQLSPYMILLGLGALTVLGFMRPRWLVVSAIALPAAYLLLHLTYVMENFLIFTSMNPSENWGARIYDTTEPWLVAHAGGLVSACMWALALLAVAALLRRRLGATPLMVLALAIAPAFTVLAASYGGEASLRVHYFAAPWLAVLVAWGLVAFPWPRVRTGAAALAITGVTALFLIAFFGRTEINVMPRDEVEASAYFYDHAEPNSLLVLVNPGFPMRLSARYTEMGEPEGGDTSPSLMGGQNAELVRHGSATAVSTTLRELADSGGSEGCYLVFSSTEARYADVNRILSLDETQRLEGAVTLSPEYQLWHQTANARIYETSCS